METLLCILAQAKFSRRMKGLEAAFKQANTEKPDQSIIFILIAVILAVVVALLVARRLRRRKTGEMFANRPYKLFTWSLKRLGIGWLDRVLLRHAARQCGLRQPTVMLFSEELLQRTVGQWIDRINFTPFRNHARSRYEVLQDKIFV